MIFLDWRVVTAPSNSAKKFGLRLRVPHESMIAAADRQVFKTLQSGMMCPYLLVIVVVEILNDRVFMIWIRVTLRKVLQCLVEAVAIPVMITCSFYDPSTVASHWRVTLI